MMENLIPGLETRPYITHRNHRFLPEDAWRSEGPNIGRNGEHLTIMFLTLNRSGLSERLCRSIAEHLPGFKGEVLVVDNGSSTEERENLRSFMSSMPFRWRIEELGDNYGVAGGRNRSVKLVNTEWVMSLDNDVYFIKNPLESIQNDIATLGCHFLSLAVVQEGTNENFIRGGHLYLSFDRDNFIIGGGSAYSLNYDAADGDGYLGTFMSGVASVFRKNTFMALGGFDEEMFIGFEDYEFSLRLFRQGLKVGAGDVRALVHDHPKPKSPEDINYEMVRFAKQRLHESAMYFEQKHGYKVWTNATEEWITSRQDELGLETNDPPKILLNTAIPDAASGRIGVVVDRNDWALANIARQIKKHLSDEWDIDILTTSEIPDPGLMLYMTKDYQLVHYLWREPLRHLYTDWGLNYVRRYFGDWETFKTQCMSSRPITLSVYDHLYLESEDIEERRRLFCECISGYTVSSKKLNEIYSSINAYPNPDRITQDGVDLGLFRPSNLERLADVGFRPLRIGWVGNGAWGEHQVKDDPKGLDTILTPAVQILRAKGYQVEEFYADRRVQHIPHYRMPQYYNEIDVLVCTSRIEGTPNPVLEAMACGVPIVSTDVGIVPEVFGPLQKGFLLYERTIESFAGALEKIITNRELLQELSTENVNQIKSWDWGLRVQEFRKFFKKHVQINSSTQRAHVSK